MPIDVRRIKLTSFHAAILITVLCLGLISTAWSKKDVFMTIKIHQQTFKVEIPLTKKEFEKGLSKRKYLPAKRGMLFYFDPKGKEPVIMWMKDTWIALDMLFIGTNGKVACIIENTKPLSLKRLQCNKKTSAVLELNAGEVEKYGVQVGDAVADLVIL